MTWHVASVHSTQEEIMDEGNDVVEINEKSRKSWGGIDKGG